MENLYLAHHGILGQKWGVRRFQDKDGSLTTAGRERYRTDAAINNIGRAWTNTAVGQRLAVNMNKGYREDKKAIKSEYKSLKSETTDKDARKQLDQDYKKTLAEARTAAAKAIYSWQSDAANEKIQSANIGKQIAKTFLLGGYGALNYDRITAAGGGRAKAVGAALVSSAANMAVISLTSGALDAGLIDYAMRGGAGLSKRK